MSSPEPNDMATLCRSAPKEVGTISDSSLRFPSRGAEPENVRLSQRQPLPSGEPPTPVSTLDSALSSTAGRGRVPLAASGDDRTGRDDVIDRREWAICPIEQTVFGAAESLIRFAWYPP